MQLGYHAGLYRFTTEGSANVPHSRIAGKATYVVGSRRRRTVTTCDVVDAHIHIVAASWLGALCSFTGKGKAEPSHLGGHVDCPWSSARLEEITEPSWVGVGGKSTGFLRESFQGIIVMCSHRHWRARTAISFWPCFWFLPPDLEMKNKNKANLERGPRLTGLAPGASYNLTAVSLAQLTLLAVLQVSSFVCLPCALPVFTCQVKKRVVPLLY